MKLLHDPDCVVYRGSTEPRFVHEDILCSCDYYTRWEERITERMKRAVRRAALGCEHDSDVLGDRIARILRHAEKLGWADFTFLGPQSN